jgi:hypothetical protein
VILVFSIFSFLIKIDIIQVIINKSKNMTRQDTITLKGKNMFFLSPSPAGKKLEELMRIAGDTGDGNENLCGLDVLLNKQKRETADRKLMKKLRKEGKLKGWGDVAEGGFAHDAQLPTKRRRRRGRRGSEYGSTSGDGDSDDTSEGGGYNGGDRTTKGMDRDATGHPSQHNRYEPVIN